MIPHKNAVVNISRLVDTAGVRTYEDVYIGIGVYINASSDRIESGFDNEGAFMTFKMLTDGILDIQIGDRVTDQEDISYKVRGTSKFKDITGSHSQHSLTIEYD